MSNPAHPSASPRSAAISSFPGRPVEPPGERARLAVRASRDRERRLRAEALRFVSVCRRELLRRDAEHRAREVTDDKRNSPRSRAPCRADRERTLGRVLRAPSAAALRPPDGKRGARVRAAARAHRGHRGRAPARPLRAGARGLALGLIPSAAHEGQDIIHFCAVRLAWTVEDQAAVLLDPAGSPHIGQRAPPGCALGAAVEPPHHDLSGEGERCDERDPVVAPRTAPGRISSPITLSGTKPICWQVARPARRRRCDRPAGRARLARVPSRRPDGRACSC